MRRSSFIIRVAFLFISGLSIALAGACTTESTNNFNAPGTSSPSPASSPSPSANISSSIPVTLPVLDALFSDQSFKTELKTKVELTDEQIAQLSKVASEEVAKLREANIEDRTSDELTTTSEDVRLHAAEAIRGVIGPQKTEAFFTFVTDYWSRGGEQAVANGTTGLLPGPNAVPKDTRIVVNIPAYRMDVFKDGALLKSYKIGIGYPSFPLPTGLRKAETIIFNPTWTPPDEPWVAKMKNVSVGEKVPAGSKLNPLGPVKIPIGMPSLIHGGKSPAKLGTFASHGCVGLTSAQVLDFSKLISQIAGTSLTDQTVQSYLKDKTKTRPVKLDRAVPVELRYETIVVEDGKLHIYRDVYDQNTNTEENLRAVLQANGIRYEDLAEDERTQILEALNAMTRNPKNVSKPVAQVSPGTAANTKAETPDKKAVAKVKKPIGKNQKEVVIELTALSGKGYPAAVNFDTGSGKPAATSTVAMKAGT